MSKLTVDEFLALVERSRLVEPERLAHIVAQWKSQRAPGQPGDAQPFAEHLIRSGLLTRWQSQKLFEGRHRGFLLGGYKLLDHLGSGGMSNVYLAEHLLMQRRVAIKVLPQNRVADSSFLARFHFEGQAVAALDHHNIVRAYDLGCEGRIHYLVMEYVEGSNLEDLVERQGPVNFHTAAGFIAQAAAGLEHAHGSGLVHRDIKPANLLVDRHGTVKILDMGLAKFKAEVRPTPAFAQDNEVLGTAEYLAPEQAVDSLSVDHRADLYSLGCTLYFLLTGHPPFQGHSSGELMAAHQQQLPPSLLVERPDAPPSLVAICRKLMAKAPANRYQRARDVADALVGWLESERAAGRFAAAVDVDPQIFSATRDTTANLQETAKIDPSVADSQSAGGSDVIPTPPPPPTPPLVPPPRDTQFAQIPTVAPLATAISAAPHLGRPSLDRPRSLRSSWVSLGRTVKSNSAPTWLWTALLSALVVGAVLLALFAFVD
ncbi:MAG: protein kinase [Pirellulales bacterium]